MKKYFHLFLLFALFLTVSDISPQQNSKGTSMKSTFNEKIASGFARLALKCVQKEYPNKLDHVMNDPKEVLAPSVMHPAFYGCFDWHSSVHGHWMLVRLLKTFPDLENSQEIRKALNQNLTAENIKTEVAYLNQENRKSFERTYGWAWLLKLQEELMNWNDADGKKWNQNLQPLTDALVQSYINFLPKQNYPIRTGVHPNTAFGIAFALDYARKAHYEIFENLLIERALTYYKNDKDYDPKWEPGGEDFFSPGLMEADLMRRILKPTDFQNWFKKFMPKIGRTKNLLGPAVVTDRTDPKLVHLDGLNLSRAWCMYGIAKNLSEKSVLKKILYSSAQKHAEAGLSNITSGNYEGEHWLASFAVYLLSEIDNHD
ncbi:MAG: DUF2891 domain-containing protein [Ignavibacteriales bacterium]|nr:DUF2891 domain-containing protein [Ignavibacteriales bacterium]